MGSIFVPAVARRLHRATAGGVAIVLPAAGVVTTLADTTSPPALDYLSGAFQVPAGIYSVTFWCTYTVGAGSGAVAVGMMVSNGTEQAREPVVDSTITAIGGYGRQGVYSRDLTPLPAPASGSPVVYPPISVAVKPGWLVWLQAAEIGVVGTPGTLLVALTGAP